MIDQIEVGDIYSTAVFRTNDLTHVNLLRRAILSEIETYAIEYVIFHTNTSSRHDEILALRLGQLVIDHSRFDNSKLRYTIEVGSEDEPVEFTSDDIKGLPITYPTPIAILMAGQRVKCEIIIAKGQAKDHAKWRPVSLISINEIKDGYFLSSLSVLRNSLPQQTLKMKDKYYFDTEENNVQERKRENKQKYYVDSVIINQNTTTVKDEFLATSIGLLDIKNEKIRDEIVLRLRKEGPGSLMTINDKYEVDFNYFADIGYISEGQVIDCDIYVKWGMERSLIKWKTVEYDYPDDTNGYQIKIKNIGMLTSREIFQKGLEKISAAANRPPITLFSQVRGKEKYGA